MSTPLKVYVSALPFLSTALITPTVAAQDSSDTVHSLEKITVIGEKIERDLQDTPSSVAAVSKQKITDHNLNDLKDVMHQEANVVPTYSGTGFTIRGITNTNVTGAGSDGDLATVYLDGSPVPRSSILTGLQDIWDAEQVEVLRGPQSTLQGRNSLAGAVIIKTVDPFYTWSGRARIQAFDENGEQRFGIAFGGPLVDDQVAFRIAAEKSQEDGFIFNPTLDRYASQADATTIRGKLLIEPAAIPDLEILLAHTEEDKSTGQEFSFFQEPLGSWSNRQVFSDIPYTQELASSTSSLNVIYDLSDRYSISSATTYNTSKRDRSRDQDYTAVPKRVNRLATDVESTTQEIKFTIETENLSGIVGAYYAHLEDPKNQIYNQTTIRPEDISLTRLLQSRFNLNAATAQLAASQYDDGILIEAKSTRPTTIKTKALFADLTWNASDKTRLFAGLRYDKETQNLESTQSSRIISTLPNPADFGALSPVIAGINGFLQNRTAAANAADQKNSTDFDAFLPKLGASYAFNDQSSAAFVIQRGYRSGGTGTNTATASIFTFDPEYTWNYELSFRNQWLDERLILNANLFYTDWKDQQVRVYLSDSIYDTEVRNVGSSSVKGYEISAKYQLTKQFNLFSSLGYTDTEIDNFSAIVDGNIQNLAGNEFPNAPQYTFAVGGTWQNNHGLFTSVSANHAGERFSKINMDQSTGKDLPETTLVNAKLGYQQEHYGIYLVASNLLDHEYQDGTFINDGNKVGRYGQPRTVGVSLEAQY